MSAAAEAAGAEPIDAPATWWGRVRHLGPGLIVTGSIVGSGELIMTTKAGSEAGFVLLWLVIIGCVIKVFVQIELGRHALVSGETTLEALDRLPGPRCIVSWILWLWLVMYVCLVIQVSGVAGSLAEVFTLPFPDSPVELWIVLATLAVIALLVWGRYRMVERVSTAMVFLFTASTLLAVVLLQWTDSRLTPEDIAEGLSFRLAHRDGEWVDFTVAFAAFGITGVGASELIYYPYWCIEKGYARLAGPREDTEKWRQRARGWISVLYMDAWLSLCVYTLATVAFYLLGAAVLHGQQIPVADQQLIESLSHMYLTSFGRWGFDLFLFGAFFVLFSTYFVATASNARLFADALAVFRVARLPTQEARRFTVKLACIALPLLSMLFFLGVGKPVSLVMVGGVAQAAMLPLLAGAALYLRYRRSEPALRPGKIFTAGLWLALSAMVLIAAFELFQRIAPLLVR
ncbi:MAG: Nramp family divalent metal transporter [Planctomycetes bacterium]|nr:Nramp family divalent metal transporter [Planctomycetota bacterium]